ncbi:MULTISPECIES: TatD family hydrolase [unclassified Campylobacter]|uniref:TatD family hydrolase n=1 Tax=unclassified Campylobacter TaxID=2593542 RepID=UPI001BDA5BEF|nr:TatD family hydrolase [Campylobacter sp. 2018MI27]MBT0885151.1 TatD family hydrolase [Campylobacter sp. 2018MI10]
MIIDTHTHLDDERYDDILDEVLLNASNEEVKLHIIPGADIKTLQKARDISHKYDNVYFAAGVHPYDIQDFDLDYLKSFLEDSKCVAIGECGLDYYKNPSEEEKNLQKEVFKKQIELSIERKLPLIIHIRDANADSLEILKAYKEAFGVLHCFNASPILLELSDRFYYGIGGVLTFKNAKNLVEILPKIKTDRLLIETDSPYLTPHPHRGTLNEPKYCKLVAQKMAEILNKSIEEIEELTTNNAKKLFKGLI